ncbi:hypothetical protein [Streptomyces sp. NPDC057557]|uniref:hypothetical protein n=1 Tax=Streptomyces sp. NPDC057557 TaxID=3346167 RepID=UPI0036A372F3
MPLDDAGRVQGGIATLNWNDTNNVDKGSCEIYGGDGIFGSPTVWTHAVFYQVMVHYPSASDPMSDRFDITWSSSSGASDSVSIHNTP